ncbi:MAG: twin-arginine translocation pathway signal [Dyadobacter sp. 50-39]|uniref:DUF1501 domain-containing protein n=1 Tax=Dyadobacter sp. 50-39 TaxID=1895756 RepID=UPI0009667140|nr:DUF1501 domain-containing protein [Dyadobacter sp. 50-39]OJV13994.1 MAG: twin-arginine translocation pathway signal [Dyadobacter sp. 50-39]
MKRQEFLKQSALTTAGTMMIPSFLKAYELGQMNVDPTGSKILVVVQLSGGNDGLNTVVPFRNDIYYRERPTLAIAREKVLALNDEIGFNPALEPLKALYDDGLVKVINNVGYPNPDRSHFRSMDIWQTASSSDQYLNTGWLGRYLDATCSGPGGCAQHRAIEVDDTLSLSMKGNMVNGLALLNPQKLYNQTRDGMIKALADHSYPETHSNAGYLYKTLAETVSSAAYVYDKSAKSVHRTIGVYPTHELGRRLKTVSELIQSDTRTRVYYVSISGFDTHINQMGQQERLLRQYAEAVKAFMDDMKSANRQNDVLVMTFSEFGRRVKQNASNGTDHGTANNVILVGGGLSGTRSDRVYDQAPDLQNLDMGDLKFTIDFRSIYATLLEDWLATDDVAILGKKFPKLSLL